jgi:hypothetical protein
MPKERAHINLDDDLDLSVFTPKPAGRGGHKPDMKAVEAVAEESGFASREPKRRRRRQRSPYQTQLNLKCREGMKALFQEIGDRLNIHDHTTFERALLALIEKEGYSDLGSQYTELTK